MSHVTIVIVSYVEKMMWQMWSDFKDYSNDMTGCISKKDAGGMVCHIIGCRVCSKINIKFFKKFILILNHENQVL